MSMLKCRFLGPSSPDPNLVGLRLGVEAVFILTKSLDDSQHSGPRTALEKCCLKRTFCPGYFFKLTRDALCLAHSGGVVNGDHCHCCCRFRYPHVIIFFCTSDSCGLHLYPVPVYTGFVINSGTFVSSSIEQKDTYD